ncbi:MAG TPA: hypothetical protein VGP16_13775, partial [Asanoa sp.]|nr:hypothetical protein [Asanoa sp.]
MAKLDTATALALLSSAGTTSIALAVLSSAIPAILSACASILFVAISNAEPSTKDRLLFPVVAVYLS